MADLASIKIGVDSRDVKSANADLGAFSQTAKSTEQSVVTLTKAQKQLQSAYQTSNRAVIDATKYIVQLEQETKRLTRSAYDLKKMEIAAAAAAAPTLELKKQIRSTGAETLRAMKDMNAGGAAIAKMGKQSGLAGHHLANLSFQLQDIVIGLQNGQKPMTVFLQQGSHIGQIMMQAGVGVGALTKAALGLVASLTAAIATNPYFLALGAVVLTISAALNALSTEWEKSGEVEAYAKSIGLTAEQIEEAGGAGITTMDIIKGLWMTISEGLNLEGVIDTLKGWFLDFGNLVLDVAKMAGVNLYAAFAGSFNAIKVLWNNFPAILSDIFVRAVNQALSAVEWLVNRIVAAVNELAGKDILNTQKFGRLVNENARAANKAADAIGAGYVDAYGRASQAFDRVKANTLKASKARMDAAKQEEKANKASQAAMSDAQKQAEQNKKTVDDYIASLKKEIDALTKTAKQLREEEKARMLAIAVTDDQRKAIEDLSATRERELSKKADANFQKNVIKPLEDELALLGLTGEAYARKALELEKEAKMAEWAAAGVTDVNAAWEQYLRANEDVIKAKSVLERERKEAEALKKTLDEITGIFSDVFGFDIAGLVKRIGAAFPDLKKDLKDIFDGLPDDIKESIKEAFKDLPEAFATAMAGAQIGGLVGGGGKTSQIGGAIGSVAGKALGSSIAALGNLGGPLGAIAGSLLGGLIGGMLSSTPRASATVSIIGGEAMMGAVTGNKSQLKKIASGMAGALIDGLESLADELGGFLGEMAGISIGMRKKTYRVDVTGQGRTKGMPSFETEQEAIAYAMKYAIDNGVIEGIRQSTQNLLRAGDDLQAALEDALLFESVFDRLLEATDPLAYGLEKLEKEFTNLRKVFDAAGATAEEYADLEQLYQIERQKIIDENVSDAIEDVASLRDLELRLIEAQGDEVAILAEQRKRELEAATESEQAILRQIYAQQDLNAARQAEQTGISDLLSAVSELNAGVAAAEAKLAEAMKAQRQRQIEALRNQITDLDAIIAKRDVAQQALRTAYDAEINQIDEQIAKRRENISSLQDAFKQQSQTFEDTMLRFRDFAATLRDFAATIIPMNGTGPQSLNQLRRRFADVMKAALGGDTAAMGQITSVGEQLRESIISNATSRIDMLRQLYALQAQTNTFADQADAQSSIAEQQLATIKAQYDAMIMAEERAIADAEAQKEALAAQVEQFIVLNEKVLSVDEAIRQLQTAEAAAIEAETQKAQLERQIEWLTALDDDIISVEQAQRELAEAQAQRDAVLAEINQNGFAQLIAVTEKTGAEMARAAMAAIQTAQQAAAQAKNAMTAANEAKANAAAAASVIAAQTAFNDNVINPYFVGSGFANGGIHSGGLRLVGENGPELETTGPSRIYNANQLGNMLNGKDTSDEVKALRAEMRAALFQIAKNTGKTSDQLNRWDGDGLPDTRSWEAA